MWLGYLKAEQEQYGVLIQYRISLGANIAHMLIAGKSGSGKSLSLKWYIFQLLANRESIVYIADYKGGVEYEALEGSPSYASGSQAFQMIQQYYDFFSMVRDQRIRLKKHYALVIEEWLGLLTYAETQSKKLKSDLQSMVAEILAVGRGLNIGIILCVQRADASLFPSGSREQFQAIVAFGRTSAEHFRMLGFSGEMEENPTGSYKAGQALCLIDGQDAPCEIIVPYIKNQDIMSKNTRFLLDRQVSLDALQRLHGEAGQPGQRG